jgi:hypothetical protein
MSKLHFRNARPDELGRLDAIRRAAFAPVFASFRSILGDEIYDLAQRREDEAQGGLLRSLLAPDSGWTVYVAESADEVVASMPSTPLGPARESEVRSTGSLSLS